MEHGENAPRAKVSLEKEMQSIYFEKERQIHSRDNYFTSIKD